jgi:hypothetical protein
MSDSYSYNSSRAFKLCFRTNSTSQSPGSPDGSHQEDAEWLPLVSKEPNPWTAIILDRLSDRGGKQYLFFILYSGLATQFFIWIDQTQRLMEYNSSAKCKALQGMLSSLPCFFFVVNRRSVKSTRIRRRWREIWRLLIEKQLCPALYCPAWLSKPDFPGNRITTTEWAEFSRYLNLI